MSLWVRAQGTVSVLPKVWEFDDVARQKVVKLKSDLHLGKFHSADCSWEASKFSEFLIEKC